MGKAKYFSNIDLATAYYYIRTAKGNMLKTALLTNEGLYEYLLMPFGLYNEPGAFLILMNLIFADCISEFIIIYLDDILVYSETY